MPRTLFVLCLIAGLGSALSAQDPFIPINDALLGVVTVPHKGTGAAVVHVVPGTPAQRFGIVVGDRIVGFQEATIKRPLDLDKALAEVFPGQEVVVTLRRKEGKKQIKPILMRRRHHGGDELQPRKRGAVDFDAAAWCVHSWSGEGKAAALDLASLKGKVVVIHAFQSG